MTNENKTIYPFVQRARRKDNKEWIEGWFHIELCDGALINNRLHGEVPVDELTVEYKIGGYWESASKVCALFENPINTRPNASEGVDVETIVIAELLENSLYDNEMSCNFTPEEYYSRVAKAISKEVHSKAQPDPRIKEAVDMVEVLINGLSTVKDLYGWWKINKHLTKIKTTLEGGSCE